jgi:hypothetical protein
VIGRKMGRTSYGSVGLVEKAAATDVSKRAVVASQTSADVEKTSRPRLKKASKTKMERESFKRKRWI